MRDFTKGNIGQSIFIFSLPLILGNLFLQLYNFVNSVLVGHFLGDVALAAVGTVYPIVFFLISLIIGIGSGASVVVSHFFGAKQYNKIPLTISTFYIFFIILGLFICFISIVFAQQIFSLLQLEEEIARLAVSYMRIYMIGMFFSFCFNSAVSLLRGLGDSKTQLYYLIAANILNGILSYIFLAVMKWDLNSTAWATVISQAAAFFTLFFHLQKTNPYIKIKKADKYFDKSILKEIVKIGFPTGIQQSVIALSQILIIGIVAMFGSNAITAYSAASRIESIALLIILNFSSALSSFVGQNYGAGLSLRVKKSLTSSLQIIGIISIITMIVFCFLGRNIMNLFSQTTEVIEIGYQYLVIMGLFWITLGAMNIFQSFFRGLGDTFIPMLISILSLWIIRIPISYLLSFKYSTTGIWIGAPISWIIAMIAYIIYYYRSKRMKNILKTLSLILILGIPCSLKAQNSLNFLSPMNIPLSSSGHFGELRSNHFHSGIDLRTNAVTGQAVICPFDGEVSRIKVQVYGGGKNLYIDHTNGYTTVYMHLENYYREIAKYVKAHQYKIQSYAFDLNVPKGKLKLKKGDTIALSGNTGSSGGPHLHYEIRNTASQKTINPVLLGLNLKDNTPPTLYSLRIIPNNPQSTIKGENKEIYFNTKNNWKNNDTIKVEGDFYICFEAYDRSNGSTEKNGVYDSKLFVDEKMIFHYNNKSFYFTEQRYANAIIDYAYLKTKGKRMLKTKQMPGCKFSNVTYANKGIISVKNGETKKITITLEDEKKNKNTYTFFLKSDGKKAQLATNNSQQKGIKHIPFAKGLTFHTNDLSQISIPANALYEDLDLQYSYSQGKYGCIHQIGNNTVPLHKKFTMKLRYNKDLTNKNKALIVRISDKGGKTSIGGKAEGDYIVASTFDLGRYTIEIDTTAPKITPKNFKDKQKLNPKQKFIQIKVTDNLAGIRNANAYLNDKWHLMEYDGKSSTIFCPASDFPKGKSSLKIVATDEKNNKTTTTFTIIK
jgi:putative MATE family efflux protein